jgi:hypothetical protein
MTSTFEVKNETKNFEFPFVKNVYSIIVIINDEFFGIIFI